MADVVFTVAPTRRIVFTVSGGGQTLTLDSGDAISFQVASIMRGPKGEPGAASGGYTHLQGFASDTWTVTHNLGHFAVVAIEEGSGDPVEGEIEHVSVNQLIVRFSAALSGRAFCV